MPITKEDRLLRIGVLGCGPISQIAHFDACRKARNADLYAICDVSPDLLARMTVIHQPRKSFLDYDEMLADPGVEAVIVATSDAFHAPLAMRALAANKHVLVEKPLALTVEECLSLRQSVLERDRVLQVGTNRRFDPAVTYAQRFIQEELGELMAIKTWYCDSVHRYTMTDNLQPIPILSETALRPTVDARQNKRSYFLLAHGSHLVDTTRFLGADLISVEARLTEKFGAYSWFVAADLADGSVAHLDLTIAVRGDFEEGFRVYGEFGSVNGRLYLPWYHKCGYVECFSVKDDVFRRPLGQDSYTYKLQIEHFADVVLHGKRMRAADVDDGLAAVRALVAIARSTETGRRISLNDVAGGV
jgi:predicted dehydrogenase